MNTITDNLRRVTERIAVAAERADRIPSDITLVAVSKFHPPAVIERAAAAGQLDFGENYPQELRAKAITVHAPMIRWHLIGHLQRNKIGKTLPLASLIHSVDSIRLLDALDAAGRERDIPTSVLIEVNLSRERNKSGFAPEEMLFLGNQLRHLHNVRVEGLMTMAACDADSCKRGATFAALRELRDHLRREWGPEFSLPHLSMGMSNDFEIAVREGATIVRIGTAIFGSRS